MMKLFRIKGITLVILIFLLILGISTPAYASSDISTSSSGFQGNTENMIIEGEITITNSIEFYINVHPNDEHASSMHHQMMSDYSNIIEVSIEKLVEYEDLDNNSLSSNDIVKSDFYLNSSTLNEVEKVQNDGILNFIINSKIENLFKMTFEIVSHENTPYAFKWSIDLEYPFVSNSSKLAVFHNVSTKSKSMMDMMDMMDGGMMGDNPLMSNMMSDDNEFLPMSFNWDDEVIVDGVVKSIVSDVYNDYLTISFPSGNIISYDPVIGTEAESIIDIDELLSENPLFDELNYFGNGAFVPTLFGITIAMVAVIVILISGYLIGKKKT